MFLSPIFFEKSVMEEVAVSLASPDRTSRTLPIALRVPYACDDGFQLIGFYLFIYIFYFFIFCFVFFLVVLFVSSFFVYLSCSNLSS